jgi:vitamin B12 transporter
VGDPSNINNTFDLNMISLGQVERVEILKGAQSTLWGSDAVAGVINIITKKAGKSSINPTAMLSYGSYQTFRGNLGFNGTIKKFSYQLVYDYLNTGGFPVAHDSTGKMNFKNDDFKQHSFQASIGYQFNDHFSFKAFSNTSKYNGSTDPGAFQDDKDDYFDNKNGLQNLELLYTKNGIQIHLTQSFLQNTRSYLNDSASISGFDTYSKGDYHGKSAITELLGNFALSNKIKLVSGLQRMAQQTDQHYLSLSLFGPYETALGDSAKTTNLAMYHSLLIAGISGFDIEAGFRYNHHSIYGNNLTYTFNPSLHLSDFVKLFVNISSAYKIPSLYQLYSEYGNKNLSPEKSTNYEIGVQVFAKNMQSNFRIGAFKRDIKDLFVFYTDPNTYASQYINRDQQHDFGFELETNIGFTKKTNWINNLTYVDGKGKNESVKIKNLYRRPNVTFNSTFTTEISKGLTFVPSVRIVGTRLKGIYDAGPDKMPAYYTLDFYVGYALSKNCKAFIDLRNITNQEYFDIVGYNSKRFNMMTGISLSF